MSERVSGRVLCPRAHFLASDQMQLIFVARRHKEAISVCRLMSERGRGR